MAQTLFDKLWENHRIASLDGGEDLIAIDRVLLHERMGAVALSSLQDAGRTPIAPERVFCTVDHIVANDDNRQKDDARMPGGDIFIRATRKAAHAAGINLIDTLDQDQGITHVIAPDLGIALPGLSVVCADSHTCSLGAVGALAWGVGSSAAEQAIATGAIRTAKPQQLRITLTGALNAPATAKDLALHIISQLGVTGAKRCAIEFAGPAVDALSLDERLTLCNMAVEFSAFTAVIAPNEDVIAFLKDRRYSPEPTLIDQAIADWRALFSDPGARFDYEIEVDISGVAPMVTWGTSPEQSTAVNGVVGQRVGGATSSGDGGVDYMAVQSGARLDQLRIDGAFIGSCTNGRLSDLRDAAKYLVGQHVSDHVKAVCVAGSMAVKRAAEAEGLDRIFKNAGFKWGAAGCAMCFYAGGETFPPGARVISSTNRNFEGRQGPGVRTHLASPATVAASAVAGHIVDIRQAEYEVLD